MSEQKAEEIILKHLTLKAQLESHGLYEATLECMNEYANERILSVAREAVEEEPDLPGSMPDDMWECIKNDRLVCEQSHRMAVQETKSNILSRIESKL